MIITKRGLLGLLGGLVLAARVKAMPTEEPSEPIEEDETFTPAWKHYSLTWKHYSPPHLIDYTGDSFASLYERNVRVLELRLTAAQDALYFNAK